MNADSESACKACIAAAADETSAALLTMLVAACESMLISMLSFFGKEKMIAGVCPSCNAVVRASLRPVCFNVVLGKRTHLPQAVTGMPATAAARQGINRFWLCKSRWSTRLSCCEPEATRESNKLPIDVVACELKPSREHNEQQVWMG